MITLSCPRCLASVRLPEKRLGKSLFVCPVCAYPLEVPAPPPASPRAARPAERRTDKTLVGPAGHRPPSARAAGRPADGFEFDPGPGPHANR